MLRKILLATDGSAPSLKAADLAAELAVKNSAEVVILFVIPSMPALTAHTGAPYFHETAQTSDHLKQMAQQVIAKTAKVFEDNHIPFKLKVEAGNPADRICWESENEGIQMIIMGTRGHNSIERFLMGSVSSRVVTYAPCSVMVVR